MTYDPDALDRLVIAVCVRAVRDARRIRTHDDEFPAPAETLDARRWLRSEGAAIIDQVAQVPPEKVLAAIE